MNSPQIIIIIAIHIFLSLLFLESIGLDPMDPKVDDKIKTILNTKVKEMIAEARERAQVVEEAYPDELKVNRKNHRSIALNTLVDIKSAIPLSRPFSPCISISASRTNAYYDIDAHAHLRMQENFLLFPQTLTHTRAHTLSHALSLPFSPHTLSLTATLPLSIVSSLPPKC